MEADSIQTYERLEKYYWWWVGRRRVIQKMLYNFFHDSRLQILDWGCGPGGNFPLLQKHGTVTGVDASPESVRYCREKGIANVIQAGTLADFRSEQRFDLATNFDVLEHIQEDERYISDLRVFLVPQGYVLVTVPAYQFLWSQLDQTLGHVRRYNRRTLVDRFENNGYEVIKASYFMFFLAPAFILYRFMEKILGRENKGSLKAATPELPMLLNWFFTRLVFIEAWLVQYINLPFGTSIILLARKK